MKVAQQAKIRISAEPKYEADVRGSQEYDGSDPKYFVLVTDDPIG